MYVNLFMNLNYLVQFLFYCVKKAGQSNTQYKSLLECGNAGTCIYMIKKKQLACRSKQALNTPSMSLSDPKNT